MHCKESMSTAVSSPLPDWFPSFPSLYDWKKTYEDNRKNGPFFSGTIPERPSVPATQWIDCLGYRIASPLGVPAGPLLSSRWIRLASQLGFDVLVYKTIRSRAVPAHPLPNILFVDQIADGAATSVPPPEKQAQLSITNSFGMPCVDPDIVLKDIEEAKSALLPGQVLIVSVVGSGEEYQSDFVRAASIAKEGGADIIEANFSCPNVPGKPLYFDAQAVLSTVQLLCQAISPLPLIVKVGYFENPSEMQATLLAIAKGGAGGIAGINTVSAKVFDREGKPALGKERSTSGICGAVIRPKALEWTRRAQEINTTHRLALTLFGGGGILLANHFDAFLQAGATVAMTATGMMWDPYLALRWHQRRKNEE